MYTLPIISFRSEEDAHSMLHYLQTTTETSVYRMHGIQFYVHSREFTLFLVTITRYDVCMSSADEDWLHAVYAHLQDNPAIMYPYRSN